MANDRIEMVREGVDASASQLHASGAAVSAIAGVVTGCGFSGATAGRIYSAQGSTIQTGIQTVAQTITAWSAAADTVGEALRASAAGLDAADVDNSSDLSGVR